MKFVVPFCLVLSSYSVLDDCFASEPIRPLEPIIISSSRIPTTLEHAITNVEVIDRATIETSQARSVTELLRYQSGLHVQQNASRGAVGSIFLRNNEANYVAVIIDGVKVNDPTNSRGGSFDFSSIDVNSIERIEIVKGAMSSMLGSDALAGAIYITTRSVEGGEKTQVSVTGGSRGFAEAAAQVQKSFGETDLSLNLGYLDEGEQTDFTGYINRSINLRANSYITNGKKLSIHGRHSKSNAQSLPDDSGGEDFAVYRDVDQRQIRESSLGLQYFQDVSSEWSYSIRVNGFLHDETVFSPGVAPGARNSFGIGVNTSDSEYERNYILWNNNVEISNRLQISLGLDHQSEEGNSFGTYDDPNFGYSEGFYKLKRKTQGVFIESLFGLVEKLNVKLGLRHDDPEHHSSQTTGNIGLRNRKGLYVYTASAGTGYKLPSFYALSNFLVGDSGLKPEKSQFWELGVKRNRSGNYPEWHFNIYSYDIENLIDFDATTFKMVNREDVSIKGAESGATYNFSKKDALVLGLHYSETNIIGSNEKLFNRPRWQVTGHLQHQFSTTLSSVASLVYVDEVYESSIPTDDVILNSYYRLDLSFNWLTSDRWVVGGVIENITDQEYQETVGTSSPGISIRLSATINI